MSAEDRDTLEMASQYCLEEIPKAIADGKREHSCLKKAQEASAAARAAGVTDAEKLRQYVRCFSKLKNLEKGKDCNSDKKRKAPTDWSTDPQACGTSKGEKFTFDLTGVPDDETCTMRQNGKWKRLRSIGEERARRNRLLQQQ